MNKNFDSIETLKGEWDSLQPLAPEHERRLWQKLRLEWNYHSNHIEGNTLTYGETVLLILHGQTHGNHTLREYEEMKAHDVGIEHLRNLAADKARLITPADIRDLNRIILKESFWKPTQTPDGQPSRAQVIPGDYKTLPNSVVTATGELFEYAPPMEVPARMQALVDWLGEVLADKQEHILRIAAKFHHDFVLIHPFDDGNGRVARMLVNYLLLRDGYPPIIVPTERKKDYLTALRLADAGDMAVLADFLGSCLIRSLQLGIKAAKGESVEEPGDLEKEIALFLKSQSIRNDQPVARSSEVVYSLYESSFKYLLSRLLEKTLVFGHLFAKYTVATEPSGIEFGKDALQVIEYCLTKDSDICSYILLHFEFDGYLGQAPKPFGVQVFVALDMKELEYTWKIDGIPVISKPYTEPVLNEEADQFVEQVQRVVFEVIKTQSVGE